MWPDDIDIHRCQKFFSLHNVDYHDEDKMFFHILECVGALSCILARATYCYSPDRDTGALKCTKRRVFWKAIAEIASVEAEGKCIGIRARFKIPVHTVLRCFPDKEKLHDGRLWLPLHFCAALPNNDLSDFDTLYNAQPDHIRQHLRKEEPLNPYQLIAMMQNPTAEIIQKMKICHPRFRSSSPNVNFTSLHIAARFSNSVEMVEGLIEVYPPALQIEDSGGHLPLHYVAENETPAAVAILRVLLKAAPETARMTNEKLENSLPLHIFLCKCRKRPFINAMIPILLEAYRDAVNIPNARGYLPIHLAPSQSFKLIAEVNIANLSVVGAFGSVAHLTTDENILRYIHSLAPQLFLSVNQRGQTPLQCACNVDLSFLQMLFELEPKAAGVRSLSSNNLLHDFVKQSKEYMDDFLSMYSEVATLCYLLRILPPEDICEENENGQTPYDMLVDKNDDESKFGYVRRLFLLAAPSFKPEELKELNYLARKNALFAFYSGASKCNLFIRIAYAPGGNMLIRKITCYL